MIQRIFPRDFQIVVTYLVTLKSRRTDKLTRIIFDSWALALNLMLCILKIVWLMEDLENVMIGCTLSGWYKYMFDDNGTTWLRAHE